MMATIFLDLDGTLTDSQPGIVRSVRHALAALALPVPEERDLNWVIGPPLIESFATLGAPDPAEALALYRARYTDVGLLENRVYDGIPDALARLRNAGAALCLATAKPHAYARRITAHFGLAPNFVHEFGPELDGTRNDKAELLAHALEVTGAAPEACVMVGDRSHDIRAARAVGMRSVWVSWGYGPGEGTGADAEADSPAEMAAAVLRLLGRG